MSAIAKGYSLVLEDGATAVIAWAVKPENMARISSPKNIRRVKTPPFVNLVDGKHIERVNCIIRITGLK